MSWEYAFFKKSLHIHLKFPKNQHLKSPEYYTIKFKENNLDPKPLQIKTQNSTQFKGAPFLAQVHKSQLQEKERQGFKD